MNAFKVNFKIDHTCSTLSLVLRHLYIISLITEYNYRIELNIRSKNLYEKSLFSNFDDSPFTLVRLLPSSNYTKKISNAMATFADSDFIFICYSKHMKIPIDYFYTERVKKQKSTVRQQKTLLLRKKFFYKMISGANQTTLGDRRFDLKISTHSK